jgi:peptidoglycan hydrolase-like protein with peptidoglycan-binding domain
MTLAELQAKINEIMAAIKKSQEQLSKIASGGSTGIAGCSITSFTKTLKQGDSGEDVKCLQIILNSAADTRIAASGIGAPGNETIYFGGLTRGAVVRFQEKYRSEILAQWNLSAGTGIVGSSTIAKLNTLLKK